MAEKIRHPEQQASASKTTLLTMLGLDQESFFKGLQQRVAGMSPRRAGETGEDLLAIHPSLHPAFVHWYETGEIPPVGPIHGYTAEDLLKGNADRMPLKPTGVFLMLNTLMTNPERAREQLRQGIVRLIPPDQPGGTF